MERMVSEQESSNQTLDFIFEIFFFPPFFWVTKNIYLYSFLLRQLGFIVIHYNPSDSKETKDKQTSISFYQAFNLSWELVTVINNWDTMKRFYSMCGKIINYYRIII